MRSSPLSLTEARGLLPVAQLLSYRSRGARRTSVRMCPHASTCVMFDAFKMQASLRLWQVSYCELDVHGHSRCERYKISAAGGSVPSNMLPNGKLLQLRVKK